MKKMILKYERFMTSARTKSCNSRPSSITMAADLGAAPDQNETESGNKGKGNSLFKPDVAL